MASFWHLLQLFCGLHVLFHDMVCDLQEAGCWKGAMADFSYEGGCGQPLPLFWKI